MKYGTKTTAKYLYPYKKGLGLAQGLSKKAQMRLKWMDYINKGNNIRKAARHFDIPESTIRYWRKKYEKWRLTTLEDGSRKPKRVRETKVTFETIQRIIELRQEYGWGKKKLQVLLKREGIFVGQTRIQKVINNSGLRRIKSERRCRLRRNRKHMYSVPKKVMRQPGGLVYLDVKHLRLVKAGPKVYQFTAIDHATRMLRVKIYSRITSRCGKMFLEYLDKHYPFDRIEYIGSDNGSEFLGDLEKELDKRKIKHVFSTPSSPKQNPFVERVIRTTINDIYERKGTELNIKKQQEVLEDYVKVYNEIRPHESLEMKTPQEHFKMLQKNRT